MDNLRKFRDLLRTSGLSDDEIVLFLAIYKNPGNSVFFYSKTINLPKDRVYILVQSLTQKKLISQQGERYKKLFVGSIDGFIASVSAEGRKLNRAAESLNSLKKILPNFSNKTKENSFESFSFDEFGERFVDLSFLKWDTVLGYGDFEFIVSQMGIEPDQDFVKRRMKRGGTCLPVVVNPGAYCKEYLIKRDESELRRTKVVYDKSLSNQFVTILPELDIVTIWSQDGGVFIKNALLSKVHQDMHKHLQDLSEKQFSLNSEN